MYRIVLYVYIEDQSGLGSALEAGLLLPRSDPSSGSDGWQRVVQRGGVHAGEERPIPEDEVRQSLGSHRENGETVERRQGRIGQVQVSVHFELFLSRSFNRSNGGLSTTMFVRARLYSLNLSLREQTPKL